MTGDAAGMLSDLPLFLGLGVATLVIILAYRRHQDTTALAKARPSPPEIISIIALATVLGGLVFAATTFLQAMVILTSAAAYLS